MLLIITSTSDEILNGVMGDSRSWGYLSLTPACAGLLELREPGSAKIIRAGCPSLSLTISAQLALKMCVVARNHEKFTKTPNLVAQDPSGHRC